MMDTESIISLHEPRKQTYNKKAVANTHKASH
jgi:hypothetical protein